MRACLAFTLTLGPSSRASVRQPVSAQVEPNDALLTTLAKLTYPPLARATRTTGDVVIALEAGSDGQVRSAAVVQGHPLLAQASLDNAQHSQFECRKCESAAASVKIVYTFQLLDRGSCAVSKQPASGTTERDDRVPGVTQSQNDVTVIDTEFHICDPAADPPAKVRSWKCLFLWRCASR